MRDQTKRAKDTDKRARRAKSKRQAHQGEATGAAVVTQTKEGEELTSRKSSYTRKTTEATHLLDQEAEEWYKGAPKLQFNG